MSVRFDGKIVSNDISSGYISLKEAQGLFSYSFIPLKDEWYTALLFDKTKGYLQYLAMNIDGNDIDNNAVIFDYEAPIAIKGIHEFILVIYTQPGIITKIGRISSRYNFSPNTFAALHELEVHQKSTFFVNADKGALIEEEIKTVPVTTPVVKTTTTVIETKPLSKSTTTIIETKPLVKTTKSKDYLKEGTNELEYKEPVYVVEEAPITMFKEDSLLTTKEKAYCACLIKQASQQPGRCHLERAFFEENNASPCQNYFQICEQAVGTHTLSCYKNFDFNGFSLVQLQTLAQIEKIDFPVSATRKELIKILQKWGAINRA